MTNNEERTTSKDSLAKKWKSRITERCATKTVQNCKCLQQKKLKSAPLISLQNIWTPLLTFCYDFPVCSLPTVWAGSELDVIRRYPLQVLIEEPAGVFELAVASIVTTEGRPMHTTPWYLRFPFSFISVSLLVPDSMLGSHNYAVGVQVGCFSHRWNTTSRFRVSA